MAFKPTHKHKKEILTIVPQNPKEISTKNKKLKKFFKIFLNIQCAIAVRCDQPNTSGASMQIIARQSKIRPQMYILYVIAPSSFRIRLDGPILCLAEPFYRNFAKESRH